ncbi:MAG TPA: NUDIX domain-containing protein [Kiritimatiellia bacterium]|nr:NUDIX domain-containing protein [Kiritimatiellia bacterium]HMP95611.1 NUDIX domain-containing protein [Kiritimatiellia bacterium]
MEWFDLVNINGTVIGKAPRNVCHGHPGLMHQAVHVLVFDRMGRLFLQKRSPAKDVQPGKWDTSVGGHLHPGESPLAGAQREMLEELGVPPLALTPAYRYMWRSEIETELITAFYTRHEGPFHLDPGEIDEGRFWSPTEIEERLTSGIFTPQFEREYYRIRECHVLLEA